MNVAHSGSSIVGGQSFAVSALKKKITVAENGRRVVREVEVKPSKDTAVRWTIRQISAT